MATSHATLNEQQPGALEPVRAFNAPLGVVSPLWLAFMGAASAGVAFWWMSRWMKPFKAVSGADVEPAPDPITTVAAEGAHDASAEAAPKTKPTPKAKTAARKSPPAIAARVSARTKRRQPADAAKGSPKRR